MRKETKGIQNPQEPRMAKIVLDTNFLLAIFQFKIDIFRELERIIQQRYEICIIDKTLDELEKLINKSRLSDKRAAKFAESVIKKKKIKIIKTSRNDNADNLLAELDKNCIIATQDQALKRRLKKKGYRIITIRQKKHLIIV